MTAPRTNPRSMTATRSSLLRRVRDPDDVEGWDQFDRLYRSLLIQYARHRGLSPDQADEIAQQCMTAIVARIETFERKNSFRGWLRGMVANKVADFIADRQRTERAGTDVLRNEADPSPTPPERWQADWNQAHVRHILSCLRTTFAAHTLQAFWLYVLKETPVSEIVKSLGMTPNQVYVAKARVTKCIREQFGEVLEGLYGDER